MVKQVGDHNAHFTLYTGAQAKTAQAEGAAAKEQKEHKKWEIWIEFEYLDRFVLKISFWQLFSFLYI